MLELQWGLECGSDVVLKKMNKSRFFSVEEAGRVIRDCHDAGIRTSLFILVGFPGETAEEFVKTLDFIRDNHAWIDQVKSINSVHIITDTVIHKRPELFGVKLPERDYHYLWEGEGGNTTEERNRRIAKCSRSATNSASRSLKPTSRKASSTTSRPKSPRADCRPTTRSAC